MSRATNKYDKAIPIHTIKSQKVQKLPLDACCQKCALCKCNMYESRPIRYAKHYVCRACTKKGYTNRDIKILLGVNDETRMCEVCHITKSNTDFTYDTDNICTQCHEKIAKRIEQPPPLQFLSPPLPNTLPKPPSPTLNPDLYANNGYIPNEAQNMTKTPPPKNNSVNKTNKNQKEEDEVISPLHDDSDVEDIHNPPSLPPLLPKQPLQHLQQPQIQQQQQQQEPPPIPPLQPSKHLQQNHQHQQQQQLSPPLPTSSSPAEQQQQQQQQQLPIDESQQMQYINPLQYLPFDLLPFIPRLSLTDPSVVERHLPDLKIPSFKALTRYNELTVVEGNIIDSYSLKIHNRKESAAIIFEDTIIIPYKCGFVSYEKENSEIEVVEEEEKNNKNKKTIYPLLFNRRENSSDTSSSSENIDDHLSTFSLLTYPQTDVSSFLHQKQSQLLSLSSSSSSTSSNQLPPQLVLSSVEQQQQQQSPPPQPTTSSSPPPQQQQQQQDQPESTEDQQQQQPIQSLPSQDVSEQYDYPEQILDPEIFDSSNVITINENEDSSFLSNNYSNQPEPIIIIDDEDIVNNNNNIENENQLSQQVKVENSTIQMLPPQQYPPPQQQLPILQQYQSQQTQQQPLPQQTQQQSAASQPPPPLPSTKSSSSVNEDDDESSRLLEAINNLQSLLTKKKTTTTPPPPPSAAAATTTTTSNEISHSSSYIPQEPRSNNNNNNENKESKDSLSQLQSLLAEITQQIKSKQQRNEEPDLQLSQEQERLIIEIAAKIEKKYSQTTSNKGVKRAASYPSTENENIQPNKIPRLCVNPPYQEPPPQIPPPQLPIPSKQQQQLPQQQSLPPQQQLPQQQQQQPVQQPQQPQQLPMNGVYINNNEYIPSYQTEMVIPEMVEEVYDDGMNNNNNYGGYGNYKPQLQQVSPPLPPALQPIPPPPPPPTHQVQILPMQFIAPNPQRQSQPQTLPLPTCRRMSLPVPRVDYNPNYIDPSIPVGNDLPLLSPERIHQLQQQQRQNQMMIQQQQQNQRQQVQIQPNSNRIIDFIPTRKYIPTEYELYQPGLQEQRMITQQIRHQIQLQQLQQQPPPPPQQQKILPYPPMNELDEDNQPILENQMVISKKKLKTMKGPNKLIASESGRGLFPFPEQGRTLVIKPQQPRAIELLSPNPPPPVPLPLPLVKQTQLQHQQPRQILPQPQQQQPPPPPLQQHQQQKQALPTPALPPPLPLPSQKQIQQHKQQQQKQKQQQQQQLPLVNGYNNNSHKNIDVRISRILFRNSVSMNVYNFYVADDRDIIIYTNCPPLICTAIKNEDTKIYLMIQQLVLFYSDLSVKVKCRRCSHKVVKRQCFIYDNDFICKACSLKVVSNTLLDCPCGENCICLRCDKCGQNVCYHKFLKFTNEDDIERQSYCSCCRLKEWKDGNVED